MRKERESTRFLTVLFYSEYIYIYIYISLKIIIIITNKNNNKKIVFTATRLYATIKEKINVKEDSFSYYFRISYLLKGG